jgi:hypothetical protein
MKMQRQKQLSRERKHLSQSRYVGLVIGCSRFLPQREQAATRRQPLFLDEVSASQGLKPTVLLQALSARLKSCLLIRTINTSTVPHPFRRPYREMGGRERTLFESRINKKTALQVRQNNDKSQGAHSPTLAAKTKKRCPEGAQVGHPRFHPPPVGYAGARLTHFSLSKTQHGPIEARGLPGPQSGT